MIAKETARKVAQILFPQLWQTSPVEAIAKAVEYLYDAAGGLDSNSQHGTNEVQTGQVSTAVKALAEHMQKHKMHVNVVARSLQVSAYTVRTWLEGKYNPNEENSAKITKFVETLRSTPEILTPEP